jgi:hypothetical protein
VLRISEDAFIRKLQKKWSQSRIIKGLRPLFDIIDDTVLRIVYNGDLLQNWQIH